MLLVRMTALFDRSFCPAPAACRPSRSGGRAKWISPEALLYQVHTTAPFLQARVPAPEPGRLIEMAGTPDGILRILASWENILRV
jgi:hypothetical protein